MLEYIQIGIDFLNSHKDHFLNFTKEYPFLGGVVGGGLLAGIWKSVKTVPNHISSIVNKQFTIEITLNSCDYEFHQLIKWYDEKGFGKKARTLRLSSYRNKFSIEKDSTLSAGFGRHWFWRRFRPFLFIRARENDQGTDKIKEQITLRTWGRSQSPIRDLMAEACPPRSKVNAKPRLYKFDSYTWEIIEDIEPRLEETINIPKKAKDKIFGHLEQFMENKEWYISNGLKHRTGMCFYGPAGTGKTSLTRLLAHKYQKDLYYLSLTGMTDALLNNAIDTVPPNGMIVIEDIDSFSSVKKRKEDSTNGALTISGILNTLDGVKSCNERIVIITTNHVDRLDSALLRPGRIDVNIELGYVTHEVFKEMMNRFYPEFLFSKKFKIKEKITPAEIENVVISNKDNPIAVLREFTENEIIKEIINGED